MAKISVLMPARLRSDNEVNWCIEAIQSVYNQTHEDWELIFVNDSSTADTGPLKEWLGEHTDSRLVGLKASGQGVVSARNQAAEEARGVLLLPLDADDRLPPDAMTEMLKVWKGQGIVYGDTLLFGQDFQKVFASQEYSFKRLLQQLIMPVGSLHRKEDWKKIGGWDPRMENGLEDWEYWVRMGVNGVCGIHIPKVTYHYRRRKNGRLQRLKEDGNNYHIAYTKMRTIHQEVYNGRRPVGCCTDGVGLPSRSSAREPMPMVQSDGDLIQILYEGNRRGRFGVTGQVTGTKYVIPGRGQIIVAMNGRPGVDPKDAPYILRQQSFKKL